MSTHAIATDEFDHEMKVTRTLLARVPDAQGEWKPHEKSFALGHLAQLVARMPGWIAPTLLEDSIDVTQGPGYSMEPTDTLLQEFDRGVASAREALASVTDEALDREWSLKLGDQLVWTERCGAAVRDHLRHLVHHRGQLTVYLRLLDVPIPSIYGPTADEPWGS